MSNIRIRIGIISLICLISIIFASFIIVKRKSPSWKSENVVSQPSSAIRFLKRIEEDAKKINLPELKKVQLPGKNDFEVRFWLNNLPFLIEGVVLRRIDNSWSAVHIHGTTQSQDYRLIQKTLSPPKSGWEMFWQKLVSSDILVLPDASEINCNVTIIDGYQYIIETNSNRSYRAYSYSNPSRAECAEAKRVHAILGIIVDEFNLDFNKKASQKARLPQDVVKLSG